MTNSDDNSSFPLISFAGSFEGTQYVPFHHHPCPELIYVIEGDCVVMVGYNEFDLHKGDLLIVPADIQHDENHLTPSKLLFVTLISSDPLFSLASGRVISFGDDETIRIMMMLVKKLRNELEFTECGGLLHTMLAYINNFEQKEVTRNGYINRVVARMERDYAQPLTIRNLAEGVQLSESHLRTLFYKEFGISVSLYLQNIRMAHARKLLLQPYNNIKQIANLCGYGDCTYFCRLFRKIHLCTPLEFRKRCYEDPDSPWNKKQTYVRQ